MQDSGLEGLTDHLYSTIASTLAHSEHAAHHVEFVNPFLKAIIGTSAGWGLILISAILVLTSAFDVFKDYMKEELPLTMRPVIVKIFSELATLGFIGLLVGSFQIGGEDSWLAYLSEKYLGEPELLFEEFETLHNGLFSVTIAFFGACTMLVIWISRQIQEWDFSFRYDLIRMKISDDMMKLRNNRPEMKWSHDKVFEKMIMHGGLSVTRPEEIWSVKLLLSELFKDSEVRKAEFLRFRERFIVQAKRDGILLPEDFKFFSYLENNASKNLRKLVTIETKQLAWIWIPLAVAVILLEGIGEVEFGDGGYKVGLFSIFLLSQASIVIWTLWNFMKMSIIHHQLMPGLRMVSKNGIDYYRLQPPPYLELNQQLYDNNFVNWAAIFEIPFGAPPRNDHEVLFGRVGANGPGYYLSSMKLLLFNSIVLLALQPIFLKSMELPEELSFVQYLAMLPPIAAIVLTPPTFLMYNWNTATEKLRQNDDVWKVLREQRRRRFDAILLTLSKIIFRLQLVNGGYFLHRRTPELVEMEWEELFNEESPDVLLDLRAIFEIHDRDKSGMISCEEVKTIADDLGCEVSAESLEQLTSFMDVNRNGHIDFKEFATAMMFPTQEGDGLVLALERLFQFFDDDGSGVIDRKELLLKLERLGFDAESIEHLLQDISGSSRGCLDRKQFTQYFRSVIVDETP